jgi:cation diffusion facilitator CzcD-associated flavoprotein CzcO
MPDGMRMRSRRTDSSILSSRGSLSLDAYAAATGTRLSRHPAPPEFAEYGLWFQSVVAPDVDRRRVVKLEREHSRFLITFDDGQRLRANRVVVAAGIGQFANRPGLMTTLPEHTTSHSCDHRRLDVFKGQNVLVVGGGQSALECATIMHERGADVEVLVRDQRVHWLHDDELTDTLGRFAARHPPADIGGSGISRFASTPGVFRRLPRRAQDPLAARAVRPAGAAWLRPRMVEIPISTGLRLAYAEPVGEGLRVLLSDGTRRKADHVLFATGYRVDVARYPFLENSLAQSISCVEGYPVLRRGMESSVPRLHFLGAPAALSFGPAMRFIAGSWFAAGAVTRAVVRPARRRAHEAAGGTPSSR